MRRGSSLALAALLCPALSGQVIEFESGGLRYQTLTRNGLTIMFAVLPSTVRDYAILQVAASNGSAISQTIRPEDCTFHRADGTILRAAAARSVVDHLMERAGRNDVIRLVTAYEAGLFGMMRFRSTNGYEARRQAFFAEVSSAKLKAAAAASAIAFVSTKLIPGQSTDGAVFFPTGGRPLGPGKLVVTVGGERYEFLGDSPPAEP